MPLLHAISEESPNVTPDSESLSDTTSWIDHMSRMLYNTCAIAEHPPQLHLQCLNFSILNTTAFFIHLEMTRIRPFFLKVSWVFLTTWSRLCRTNAHVRGLTRPEMSSTSLSDLRFRARFMPLLCHASFHSFRALLRPCSFLDMKKTLSSLVWNCQTHEWRETKEPS